VKLTPSVQAQRVTRGEPLDTMAPVARVGRAHGRQWESQGGPGWTTDIDAQFDFGIIRLLNCRRSSIGRAPAL
jgi:hypothetical protein